MEYLVVIAAVVLAMYASNTKVMRNARYHYAPIVFFILYPIFFYFVIYKEFSWFKLGLFVIMIGSSIYYYIQRKRKEASV